MSLIAVFDPKSPRKTDAFVLDATLSEEHALENKVTSFPREDGAVLNDHIINSPRRLTLQGMVTNAPVREPDPANPAPGNRAEMAFAALEAMHEKREPVTVVTRMRQYDNMAIEKISIPRSPSTGRSLEFTLNLIEIRRAQSRTVAFASRDTATEDARPHENMGKQSATASSAGAEKNVLQLT